MAGRPSIIPTDESRVSVYDMARVGLPHRLICKIAMGGMSENSLRTHYKKELDRGGADGGGQLMNCAMQEALKGNTAIIIFLLKTRLGMSEKNLHEITGKDGGAIKTESGKTLTDEQLAIKIDSILDNARKRADSESDVTDGDMDTDAGEAKPSPK